jgi:sugar lactone lactonase YvrE
MRNTTLLVPLLSLIACADDPVVPEPDLLALPGDAYYPESVHADTDGTLYVGSLATGSVVAFERGATEARTVIAAGAHGVTGVTGVLVRDDELWLCSVDTTFARPTEIRSFTLAGEPLTTHALAPTMFCNDLAFDGDGNLFATDSFGGTIQRLALGGSDLETYASDPRFVPDSAGAFGLDGIAFIGDTLYVNKLDSGELFAIDGQTITEIVVTPALVAPDGMRALDGTLVVIEGAGRLSRLELDGNTATSTPLATDLDMPTGVAVARGSAWVTEGQLGRLFSNAAPNLPFAVRRIAL